MVRLEDITLVASNHGTFRLRPVSFTTADDPSLNAAPVGWYETEDYRRVAIVALPNGRLLASRPYAVSIALTADMAVGEARLRPAVVNIRPAEART